eukprot:Lithocolla_globosa_v1_NODE_25_length_9285_cov_133.641170.p7 type:complete len:125 gc:universal NODE_25_length_9285_cov_133.641170:6982-6608(-)
MSCSALLTLIAFASGSGRMKRYLLRKSITKSRIVVPSFSRLNCGRNDRSAPHVSFTRLTITGRRSKFFGARCVSWSAVSVYNSVTVSWLNLYPFRFKLCMNFSFDVFPITGSKISQKFSKKKKN